jgi:hypothetical protein
MCSSYTGYITFFKLSASRVQVDVTSTHELQENTQRTLNILEEYKLCGRSRTSEESSVLQTTNSVALSPQANYTDWATPIVGEM